MITVKFIEFKIHKTNHKGFQAHYSVLQKEKEIAVVYFSGNVENKGFNLITMFTEPFFRTRIKKLITMKELKKLAEKEISFPVINEFLINKHIECTIRSTERLYKNDGKALVKFGSTNMYAKVFFKINKKIEIEIQEVRHAHLSEKDLINTKYTTKSNLYLNIHKKLSEYLNLK